MTAGGGAPDSADDELDAVAARVAAGDLDAIAAAYDATASMLASVAFAIVRDRRQAEDVVQDVFVKLVGVATTLRVGDARGLRAWLVRATRNRSLDVVRSARSRHEAADAPVPDLPAPQDPVPWGPDPGLVAALDQLTEDQRQALLLFHVAGLDGREVADVMDRSRAAVYRLLRRAEKGMRTALAASDVAPPSRPSDRRPS